MRRTAYTICTLVLLCLLLGACATVPETLPEAPPPSDELSRFPRAEMPLPPAADPPVLPVDCPTDLGPSEHTALLTADLTGDGSPELVWATPEGIAVFADPAGPGCRQVLSWSVARPDSPWTWYPQPPEITWLDWQTGPRALVSGLIHKWHRVTVLIEPGPAGLTAHELPPSMGVRVLADGRLEQLYRVIIGAPGYIGPGWPGYDVTLAFSADGFVQDGPPRGPWRWDIGGVVGADPLEAVSGYYTAASRQDVNSAWFFLSRRRQAATDFAAHAQQVLDNPGFLLSAESTAEVAQQTAAVRVQLAARPGQPATHGTWHLVWEDGWWKLDEFAP